MSTKKWLFSAFMTFVFVGMLSSVVLAVSPTAPTNLDVSWSQSRQVVLQWDAPADMRGGKYLVTVDNGVARQVNAIDTMREPATSIRIDEIDPNDSHTFSVVAVNLLGQASPASIALKTTAVEDYYPGYGVALSFPYNQPRLGEDGIHNQKVHGAYQNNTNSCSGCHATHTGQDSSLLHKTGKSEACLGCHDGTMGFYDVTGPDESGKYGNAGVFDSNAKGTSMHNMDISLAAAPGGSTDLSKFPAFGDAFTCSSCHNAHGSDSARHLNTDPLGWGQVAHDNTTELGKLGTLYNGIQIVNNSVPAAKINDNADMIWVRYTNINVNNAPFNGTGQYQFTANKDISTGDDVLVSYWWNPAKNAYDVNFSLILNNRDFLLNTGAGLAEPPIQSDNFIINYKDGYLVSKNGDTTVRNISAANVPYGIGVDMLQTKKVVKNTIVTTTLNRSYYDATVDDPGKGITAYKAGDGTSLYLPESGAQMSRFCSACHNDYLSLGLSEREGVHMKAYRHASGQFGRDAFSCVYCHYAHGTSVDVMRDAQDRGMKELTATGGAYANNPSGARDYLMDTDRSSALKRYTNNAVCFSCHGGEVATDVESQASRIRPGTGIIKGVKVGYNRNGVISEPVPASGDDVLSTATGKTAKGN